MHVQFEAIHPFMDGNGRLGRLLIPLILLEAGVLTEPLLYLSVFLKKHRQAYYERLQQVRITGDWEVWLLFFVDAVADTAAQAVATAQKLNLLREQDKARLAEMGRQAGSAGSLLDALFQRPITNAARLCERTGLTPATVGKLLSTMESRFDIVQEITGQKRNRIFAYRAYIDILNQDTP